MIGFSFSPGGLLFPYHLGVIKSLTNTNHLTEENPIAGSSAGAIAVASHAANVTPEQALEGCIRISDACEEMGGARGRLLPLLEQELNALLPQDAHRVVNERSGLTGLAYKEVFPVQKNVLATRFDSREQLIEDVCNSSMFPFFSSPWPCVIRKGKKSNLNSKINDRDDDNAVWNALPRVVVDGYFTVPRERFGCPDLEELGVCDRTVTISVLPHDAIGLTASDGGPRDRISPVVRSNEEFTDLFRGAVSPSPRKFMVELFERGVADGEAWASNEVL
uniref:PNPLA domain-containing protein n=1 Tax=Leptocylindrus danicus TaxID=163516 RepID=A0A7S2KLG9_9STRA|mmetsp:Transcript_24021/g.36053  ORF Transcript_24021/g.36053 Transcript_24021/m.36053 type:complete len:277 (+) Transcript_24021:89-919(+)